MKVKEGKGHKAVFFLWTLKTRLRKIYLNNFPQQKLQDSTINTRIHMYILCVYWDLPL